MWVAGGHPFTANSFQEPGTPFSLYSPRFSNSIPDPTTRSLTFPETHFFGTTYVDDSGCDVHCQSSKIVASNLALARVQSHSQLHTVLVCGVGNRLCTADGPRRTLERCKESVSSSVDLSPPETPQLLSHLAVMGVEKRALAQVR